MKFLLLTLLLNIWILEARGQTLIASYPFTSDASDASGNGYDGTLYGNAAATDTLLIGDNATDYVSLPTGLLVGLQDLTITFLVKFGTIHTLGAFSANTVMHAWGINNQDELKLSYNHNASVFQVSIKTNQVTFPFIANANQWYCFSIVRSNSQITLYIDGSQVGFTQSSAVGSLSPSSSGFVLGEEEDCMGGCFVSNQSLAGTLDDLEFYDYAFTSQQVSSCSTQSFAPAFASSDTDVCEKFCLNFFDQSNNNPTAWQWFFPGGAPGFSTVQNPTDICYPVPGVYGVTLITTGANGNDTLTLPDFITVNATPPFPVISQAGYILTSSPANSYQWQFNSVDITGATSQSYAVLQSGYYTVIAGDSNGCKNSTSVYVLIAGIHDVIPQDNIFIFPNPANDNTTINFPRGKNTMVRVLNELGEEVLIMQPTNSSSLTLPLKNLPSGIYLAEIACENQLTQTEKLQVAH